MLQDTTHPIVNRKRITLLVSVFGVSIIVIDISLVLAPASDCDPKLIFRATTIGLKSLSARLLSAGIFLLSAQ